MISGEQHKPARSCIASSLFCRVVIVE